MKTLILSALAVLSLSGGALAAPAPAAAPTVTVPYADLDLSQAKDAATMLKRIRHAAGEVCRDMPGAAGNDPETIERVTACYRQTLARAVAGLNAPRVSEAYAPGANQKRLARLP